MKLKRLLFAAALVSIASGPVSAGEYRPGYVTISGDLMHATMNVRYNNATGNAKVWAHYFPPGGVLPRVEFGGQDANGKVYTCFILPSEPIYEGAVDIATNLRNGAVLKVTRLLSESRSKCTNVVLTMDSAHVEGLFNN